MTTSSKWSPPPRLGEYRLVRPLGHGGMGHVWLAHDELLDRAVAVKVIDAAEPRPDQRERFMQEARAAARLSHPNVLAIHRVGELGNMPYIVAELVRGESLDRLAKPQPWRRVAELGLGLARGLAAAHRGGVLHRDLKPSNAILTEDGTVKIVDFGLAKLLDGPAPTVSPASSPAAVWTAAITPVLRPVRLGEIELAVTRTMPPPEAEAPADMGVRGELTGQGAILGTPYYMSPEAWLGEPQTRRSDLYALGALLYELATGQPPFVAVPPEQLAAAVTRTDAPSLALAVPDAPTGFVELVDRCLARNVEARPASADEVREALERLLAPPTARAHVRSEDNPYRGLQVFQAEHRELLFGRQVASEDIVERLRGQGLVVVAGDSGIGKSSLCRAGVLPRVTDGALAGGKRWSTAIVTPGLRPIEALAAALVPVIDVSADDATIQLAEPASMATRWLMSRLGHDRGLCLLVDPLDELVLRAPAREAAVFAGLLGELAAQVGPIRVLATARGDMLTRLAALPGLVSELPRALVVVPPLDSAALREVIVGPAAMAGISFEPPELVDELVGTAETTAGGLPLLSFALARMWAARDVERGVIGRAAVDAVGGVDGALGRQADEVMSSLPHDQRAAARQLLLALVDAAGADVVRTAAELVDGPVTQAVLDAFVRGRLIRVHDTGYALAHPRLATEWPTLRDWLDASAEHRAARERTVRAAAEWDRLGRTDSAVWRDGRLVEASLLPVDQLGPRERAFLTASRRVVRRQRALRVLAVLALPVLAAIAWGTIRVQSAHAIAQRAEARLVEAHAALDGARARARDLAADRQAALARFDRGDATAEAAWAEVVAEAALANTAWSRAAQLAETALLIDSGNAVARSALADALYGRALAAEATHRDGEVDELLERLALYDQSGARIAAWRAPAKWSLRSTPPGAALEIEQFIEDAAGARWQRIEAPARTPAILTLAPGSYRARLGSTGKAGTYLPVQLVRGEDLLSNVTLLDAARVPSGWIHVPAGRYLAGSSEDDQQRRDFYHAAPLHQVETTAYLIQQHEATWQEWISYLDTLPAVERAAQTPRAAAGGALGGVELRRVDSTWELAIQPGSVGLRARLGEPLRYPDRTDHAVQDWRKLPVTGVTANQVRIYARALGARLGLAVRMCRELEWERAARGADGRAFPHGQRVAPTDVNHEATYGRRPTTIGPDEVGSHPASRSPFGLDDMAGNVFELVDGHNEQWARGGAYAFDVLASRTELRDRFDANLGSVAAGFRLCADPPQGR